jgi:hypothetical protein
MWLLRLLLFRRFWLRRIGPLGILLTVWDIWRRIPARRREQLVRHGRTQGMRLARRAPAMRRRTSSRFR